jgi:aryl-alcohol dehydrogenase-like predicted oxidoreductase
MPLDSYVTLGRSGLRVSPFALGAMTFGEDGGSVGTTPEESGRILDAYLERGGNMIDTANFYSNGHSEAIVGDHLAARPGLRDRLVLATKFFGNLHPGDPNAGGAGRGAIRRQLEESLRRLRTDHVDVYYLHNHDRHTPIEETMSCLDDLVRAGTVRYVGFSNTPAWVTAQAQTMAALRAWTPITALQVEYSLLARTVEGELVPLARDAGMGMLPWSPLRSGFLSGKYHRGDGPADSRRAALLGGPSEDEYAVIEVADRVAAELGTTTAAVALAWLRGKPGVTAPIVGARRVDQLEANLAALDVELTAAQRAELDAVSEPTLNAPEPLIRATAAMLQFAGSTVDGVGSTVYPPLAASAVRY